MTIPFYAGTKFQPHKLKSPKSMVYSGEVDPQSRRQLSQTSHKVQKNQGL
jgi:hypothetical protein